jgi:hypothetical protein
VLIDSLSEDEQIDLVTLAWLGRDEYSASDWPAVREEAARARNQLTAEYVLGMPLPAISWRMVSQCLVIPAANSKSSVFNRADRDVLPLMSTVSSITEADEALIAGRFSGANRSRR